MTWKMAGLFLLAIPTAYPSTLSIIPSIDTSLYSEGDLSNGQGISLFSGRTKGGSGTESRRALLQFDVAALIPAGSVIESVSLRLYVSKIPQDDFGDYEFGLYRLTSSWGEGASDAGAVGGRGAPAEVGDATWTHNFFSTQSWNNPGGDFIETPSATEIISGLGYYDWFGSGLVTDMQAWVDSPSSNFGWILVGPENLASARRFESSEFPDERFRPALTIVYTAVPEPAMAALLMAFSFLGWVVIRRCSTGSDSTRTSGS